MPSEKEIKAAIKEGGKKGQDIAGMSDLGGVKFFTLSVESANGDMELLEKVMEGFNKEVDESADDRKGGAGDLGKMLLSAGDKNLAILCHVPDSVKDKVDIHEWLKASLSPVGDAAKESGGHGENIIGYNVAASKENERFPLKDRDNIINQSFVFLKAKQLVIDDDSDDDYVDYSEAAGIEW